MHIITTLKCRVLLLSVEFVYGFLIIFMPHPLIGHIIINTFVRRCEIVRAVVDNPGAVVQLNMGLGKTRVIVPMLLLHWRHQDQIVSHIVHACLHAYRTNCLSRHTITLNMAIASHITHHMCSSIWRECASISVLMLCDFNVQVDRTRQMPRHLSCVFSCLSHTHESNLYSS